MMEYFKIIIALIVFGGIIYSLYETLHIDKELGS